MGEYFARRMSAALRILAFAIVSTATISGAVAAQDARSFGLTWSMNPESKQYLGLHVFAVGQKRIGFFAEFRITRGYPEQADYRDHIDVVLADSFGDQIREESMEHENYAAGVMYRFTSRILAHAGLGYTASRGVQKRYDRYHILGEGGEYYIYSGEESSGVSFTGGATLLLGRMIAVQVGYESVPRGLILGFGIGGTFHPGQGFGS